MQVTGKNSLVKGKSMYRKSNLKCILCLWIYDFLPGQIKVPGDKREIKMRKTKRHCNVRDIVISICQFGAIQVSYVILGFNQQT